MGRSNKHVENLHLISHRSKIFNFLVLYTPLWMMNEMYELADDWLIFFQKLNFAGEIS